MRTASAFLHACLAAALVVVGSSSPASAADTQRLHIARLAAPPRLDDVAAGRIPEGMTRVSGFLQRDPRDGDPVSRETTAYVGYDAAALHVVFVCKEAPGVVRAHMTRREAAMDDDVVAVFLDTFHDHRHGYNFSTNPLGVQMDALITDGQEDDYSFDTVWESEGRVTADGFVVRMAIPFRSLRFSSAAAQTWGIGFARILPTRNETSFWPRLTRQISSQIEQLADADGLEGISPGRNLQFIPYSAFTGSRYLDEAESNYDHSKEGRIGLDAKMVIKDAMTLDLALNPDFSQVESDEPQVTVNQRFEVQFPEKRPFFIENSSYFNTPEELFFSRRIADPRFGARLTGRAGAWTVAGLVMDDRAPGERAARGTEVHGQGTTVAVGRVVREFGRQSTAGVLVTSRDFGRSSNRVASADLRLRLGDHWTVAGQAIGSRTTSLDGTTHSGPAFVGEASYQSRALSLETRYTDRSPGFRSELGFVPRADIRLWESEAGYTFFPRNKAVTSWGPEVEASVNWDRRGRVQDWEVGPELEIEWPASTQLHMRVGKSYELYQDVGFEKYDAGVYFETQRLRWLWINSSYFQGTAINYYPAAGLLPFLGDSREVELGFTITPRPQARLDQTYIYDELTTDRRTASPACACNPAPPGPRSSVFRLQMLRTKASYQFTRELSLRGILDYNLLTPNAAFVALERDRRLTADLLVTYLLNPGTALYVGYTDAYANLLLDPRLAPSARRGGGATTSVGRQFFVKVSYLFRY